MTSKFNYVCECCKRPFQRSKPTNVVMCRGCKRLASRKKDSEAQRRFEEGKKKISAHKQALFSDPERKAEVLGKANATNLKRFGCERPAQNPDIAQKGVETQLANNGYVGWQNKELREKAQRLAHTDEANKKRRQTSLENWNETHHFKNKKKLESQWDSYKERTGFDHPAQNPETNHAQHTKGYLFEGVHFDSSWELAYYIWLRDNGKSFIYHPPHFLEYFDDEGKKHLYRPDFLVQGKFVEIKGDNFFNEKGEPYNCYSKTYWWNKFYLLEKYKVEIVRFEEIRKYLKYIKDSYGKDFLKSFKIK